MHFCTTCNLNHFLFGHSTELYGWLSTLDLEPGPYERPSSAGNLSLGISPIGFGFGFISDTASSAVLPNPQRDPMLPQVAQSTHNIHLLLNIFE